MIYLWSIFQSYVPVTGQGSKLFIRVPRGKDMEPIEIRRGQKHANMFTGMQKQLRDNFLAIMRIIEMEEEQKNMFWWFEPLWKIWKSIGMIIPNIWYGKIKNVPNHQPVFHYKKNKWRVQTSVYCLIWPRSIQQPVWNLAGDFNPQKILGIGKHHAKCVEHKQTFERINWV